MTLFNINYSIKIVVFNKAKDEGSTIRRINSNLDDGIYSIYFS